MKENMKKLFYTGLLMWLSVSLSGQSLVTGYVYEDLNNNGKKDPTEKGIPGVSVSNGTDVTRTDASGAYQLPLSGDALIFVIKPAGYRLALDTFNLPRSYYTHKPEGAPKSFYKGVEPTGALPGSVDFALHKYDEPESFTSLIFGDTQPYTEEEIKYLKKGIITEAAANSREAVFGITLGDLVGDNLSLHLPYKQAIRSIGIPWYNVIGNHNMNYDAKEERFSDETFEADFGPANYAFNYGKAHFIVLDDILYPHPSGKTGYWGGLRDDQLAFVGNDLAYVPAECLIVVAVHIPLMDPDDAEAFRDTDRQQLCRLLENYPNVLFLSAHTHLQAQHFIGKEQGAEREKPIHEYNAGTTCGDWYSGILNAQGVPASIMRDGTPPGYAFLRIHGNRYVLDYKVLGKPEDYRMSVYHPEVVSSRSPEKDLYVNFFMGSPEDVVEYRVDKGEWTKMQLTTGEADPAYSRYVQDWDKQGEQASGRRPSDPAPCRHLWKGEIPADLPAGEHQIEIKVKDMFDRVFTERTTYQTAPR
jgi:hypothetical protein